MRSERPGDSIFRFLCGVIENGYRPDGDNGGHGVLINDVLLSVAVKNDDVVVEALDDPLELEAVGQVNGQVDLFLPGLIEKNVLQIHIFMENPPVLPPSPAANKYPVSF